MTYIGKVIKIETNQCRKTKSYQSYEQAEKAAIKLAKRHRESLIDGYKIDIQEN